MQQRFFELEKILRRAPLGLRFLDLVRGIYVNDGLIVTAWQNGTVGPKQRASVSPQSGVYGFRTLPGLESYMTGEKPASYWCTPSAGSFTSSPPLLSADELLDFDSLLSLIIENESPAKANFIVTVEDSMSRFMPLLLLLCLPKERLVEIPLFSGPARSAPAGLGVVRGELAIQQEAQKTIPASWAVVTTQLDGHTYVAIADARGMFTIFVPYASALPPLGNASSQGSGTIDQLSWTLQLQVFYEPAKQNVVPFVAQPDLLSLLQQGRATVYATIDKASSAIQSVIHFGGDLIVKTEGQSQLFVNPV